jgi:hypothetical protein
VNLTRIRGTDAGGRYLWEARRQYDSQGSDGGWLYTQRDIATFMHCLTLGDVIALGMCVDGLDTIEPNNGFHIRPATFEQDTLSAKIAKHLEDRSKLCLSFTFYRLWSNGY